VTAHSLTIALGGRWNGRYGMACCPVHADRTPSLKISDDPGKSDGIDLVCFAGCEWREVKAALALHMQGCSGDHVPTPKSRGINRAAMACKVLALQLWQQSTSIGGTSGEAT
jgi:hypothetical protein